jgi:hypothetical protein
MTRKQIEWWARTRAKGRAHFVWLRGVTGFGLSMTIVFWLATAALSGWSRLISEIPRDLIVFSAAGFVWGMMTWHLTEYIYKRATRRETEV